MSVKGHLQSIMSLSNALIWLVSASIVYINACECQEIIHTKNGPLRGSSKTVNGAHVLVFQGIPFAEAPVGQLRFSKPVPKGKWKGVLNATENGASCIQFLESSAIAHLVNAHVSEDCLFLNIYVPDKIDKSSLKSVMVWIHGGGYAIGTGSHIHADLLAVTGGTVVVTINYRLNIFGFLATKGSPGNIGLWDQTLALQWVQDNVLEFGGDPRKVTIFGESAGGTSVSQLALSPHTKGLFHRVISESGVLYSPWAWSHQQDELVAAVAKYLHCPQDSHMVDCFRQHSALTIFVAATNARNEVVKNMMGIPFAPVVDGDFFPESPMVTLKQKSSESYLRFISLDYMAGTMNAEGGLVILGLTSPHLPFNVSQGVPTSYVVKHVIPDEVTYFYDSSNQDKIQDAIIKMYAADPKVDIVTQGRKLVDMYGDMMFVAPTLQLLRAHANSTAPRHGATYQFYFTHVPSHHMIPTMPWIKGANHVDELPYVFGAKTMYPSGTNLTPEEQKLSLEIMKYWSNFAKTGNPNNGTGVTWPEFLTSNQSYIELGDAIQAKVNILPQRMRLWLEEIPNLLG